MLQIKNINKFYGSHHALKDVSLTINRGKVFCLLGPNGSGKSTLVHCLLSLINHKSGRFMFEDTQFSRKKIGVIMEEEGYYRDMSVYKNLYITSVIKDCRNEDINKLIDKVGLKGHEKKKVRKLSQGMKKRLSIANSLIGNPELLVWDEPYNALDPDGFMFIRSLINDLKGDGKTIFICTHLLDEVERTADDIGLLYNGKVLIEMEKVKVLEQFSSVEKFYSYFTSQNN